jgi:hypothetical protein
MEEVRSPKTSLSSLVCVPPYFNPTVLPGAISRTHPRMLVIRAIVATAEESWSRFSVGSDSPQPQVWHVGSHRAHANRCFFLYSRRVQLRDIATKHPKGPTGTVDASCRSWSRSSPAGSRCAVPVRCGQTQDVKGQEPSLSCRNVGELPNESLVGPAP